MAAEFFPNRMVVELSTLCDSDDTTINITDMTAFLLYAAGLSWGDGQRFRVRVDDELMMVTGFGSDYVTVQRGVEGTTPASHTSGAEMRTVLTGEGVTVAGHTVELADPGQGNTFSIPVDRDGVVFVGTAEISVNTTRYLPQANYAGQRISVIADPYSNAFPLGIWCDYLFTGNKVNMTDADPAVAEFVAWDYGGTITWACTTHKPFYDA